jgi:hypothetical protein
MSKERSERMENYGQKKEWVKPELVNYGAIAEITKGGTGWKTTGTGDDWVQDQLTPFQSCC